MFGGLRGGGDVLGGVVEALWGLGALFLYLCAGFRDLLLFLLLLLLLLLLLIFLVLLFSLPLLFLPILFLITNPIILHIKGPIPIILKILPLIILPNQLLKLLQTIKQRHPPPPVHKRRFQYP